MRISPLSRSSTPLVQMIGTSAHRKDQTVHSWSLKANERSQRRTPATGTACPGPELGCTIIRIAIRDISGTCRTIIISNALIIEPRRDVHRDQPVFATSVGVVVDFHGIFGLWLPLRKRGRIHSSVTRHWRCGDNSVRGCESEDERDPGKEARDPCRRAGKLSESSERISTQGAWGTNLFIAGPIVCRSYWMV